MSAIRHGSDRHLMGELDAMVWRLEPDRIRLTWYGEEFEMTATQARELGEALMEAGGALPVNLRAIRE